MRRAEGLFKKKTSPFCSVNCNVFRDCNVFFLFFFFSLCNVDGLHLMQLGHIITLLNVRNCGGSERQLQRDI